MGSFRTGSCSALLYDCGVLFIPKKKRTPLYVPEVFPIHLFFCKDRFDGHIFKMHGLLTIMAMNVDATFDNTDHVF